MGRVNRQGSDAFGVAYPSQTSDVRPMEAYVKTVRSGRSLIERPGWPLPHAVPRLSAAAHGYSGFTRAPLIRYGGNSALSNTALEADASVLVGVPSLTVEAGLGRPPDLCAFLGPRRSTGVIRARCSTYLSDCRVSHINTRAHAEGPWVRGRTTFTGVDGRSIQQSIRCAASGLPACRGTRGQRGGHIDVTVHRVRMGPVHGSRTRRAARLRRRGTLLLLPSATPQACVSGCLPTFRFKSISSDNHTVFPVAGPSRSMRA